MPTGLMSTENDNKNTKRPLVGFVKKTQQCHAAKMLASLKQVRKTPLHKSMKGQW